MKTKMITKIVTFCVIVMIMMGVFMTTGSSVMAATTGTSSLTSTPTNTLFSCGWETGITGNGCWDFMQAVNTSRFQRETSIVRNGGEAVRIEVDPGDSQGMSGERSEVYGMRDANGVSLVENETSGTQFYTISLYLPANWKSPNLAGSTDPYKSVWGMPLQLHGPDIVGASPAFAMEISDKYFIDVSAGDLTTNRWKDNIYSLSDGSLNLGHWSDFVIKIKFAKDATGSVDIWRRNEGSTAFTSVLSVNNIETLQYRTDINGGAVGNHYWKTGFYRNADATLVNVLYSDSITRGSSFDAVVAAAFPNAISASTPTATTQPTLAPTATTQPTLVPTATTQPTLVPTATTQPTLAPTATTQPTLVPTAISQPTLVPTATSQPTQVPTVVPTFLTTKIPTQGPTSAVVDLALKKNTGQSSNYQTTTASRAVDGNTDGVFNDNSVTATNSDSQAWWQVDLGASYPIQYINLWNRTDCCNTRLSNFYVFVSDSQFLSTNITNTINQVGVTTTHFTGTGGRPTIININHSGRYVRVQLSGTNYLSLAEVQVMGLPTAILTNMLKSSLLASTALPITKPAFNNLLAPTMTATTLPSTAKLAITNPLIATPAPTLEPTATATSGN